MGREWNDKLKRRLQDSVSRASDTPHPGKLLLTDLEPDKRVGPFNVLVEVLDETNSHVIAEFLVPVDLKPKVARYRDDRDWPGASARAPEKPVENPPCPECGYHHPGGTCWDS
jgi:hypothetical protein